MPCVLQDWVCDLSFMKQSVLIAAVRGPDGLHKNHVSKKLQRWLRRCVLLSAFDKRAITTPYEQGGGSFTGPSCEKPSYTQGAFNSLTDWQPAMTKILDDYIRTLDEVPHHFQLHFLHATEIIGYSHPTIDIGFWWLASYKRLCADMHLNPETFEQMNYRLGDDEHQWRNSEVVRAD